MLTILTGLSSAFSYAVSDILSQRVTRETRPLAQMVWVLATGVIISVPIALLVDGLPDGGAEWRGAGLGALAGVVYFGAFFCLLRGLHVGDLGLVSALTSLQGAYVAVIVIVLLGAADHAAARRSPWPCAPSAPCSPPFEGRAKIDEGRPLGLRLRRPLRAASCSATATATI